MIFNSLTFLLFLVIVVSLFWLTPNRVRIWLVFLSSLVFYGFWRWEFLTIVLISTLTDYVLALKMNNSENNDNDIKRKKLLYVSLAINLSLLFYFKYLFFFTDSLADLGRAMGLDVNGPTFNIILPLGISFYTFQTISYSVDVYRRHTQPIRDFALYGSYVTFFPQLVAGPVLRAEEVVNQIRVRAPFNIDFITEGVKRILYGLFLKVVLADNIAPLVDYGYGLNVHELSALDTWSLAFLFGFQIYFDFAGYSHIAIGCAKLMGINFPENFNFPYAAKSFKSFWKRWHISLSSWIRDYLYLPLLGSKVIDPSLKSQGGIGLQTSGLPKTKALFSTWAIMGLWHGANWTFVFWGLYHAILIYIERLIRPIRQKFNFTNNKVFTWSLTLPLIMLGWIPFRSASLSDAFWMMSKVVNPQAYFYYTMRENVYLVTFVLFVFVTAAYIFAEIKPKLKLAPIILVPLRVTRYAIMIVLVYTFFRPISQFIYFQF